MLERPKTADEGEPICGYIHPTRGQCPYRAMLPGGNCILHGGSQQLKAQEKKALYHNLQLAYRERLDHLTSHKEHYALNEEVGILRMLLEEILVKTQGDTSLLIRSSGQISELVTKIEKVVTSAQKAEKYIGGLLSRDQAIQMLQDAVNIIAEEIQDQDLLDRIATRLSEIAEKEYKDVGAG